MVKVKKVKSEREFSSLWEGLGKGPLNFCVLGEAFESTYSHSLA